MKKLNVMMVVAIFAVFFVFEIITQPQFGQLDKNNVKIILTGACGSSNSVNQDFCESPSKNYGCPTEWTYVLGVPIPGAGKCYDNTARESCSPESGLIEKGEGLVGLQTYNCSGTYFVSTCVYSMISGCYEDTVSLRYCSGGIDHKKPGC